MLSFVQLCDGVVAGLVLPLVLVLVVVNGKPPTSMLLLNDGGQEALPVSINTSGGRS